MLVYYFMIFVRCFFVLLLIWTIRTKRFWWTTCQFCSWRSGRGWRGRGFFGGYLWAETEWCLAVKRYVLSFSSRHAAWLWRARTYRLVWTAAETKVGSSLNTYCLIPRLLNTFDVSILNFTMETINPLCTIYSHLRSLRFQCHYTTLLGEELARSTYTKGHSTWSACRNIFKGFERQGQETCES